MLATRLVLISIVTLYTLFVRIEYDYDSGSIGEV